MDNDTPHSLNQRIQLGKDPATGKMKVVAVTPATAPQPTQAQKRDSILARLSADPSERLLLTKLPGSSLWNFSNGAREDVDGTAAAWLKRQGLIAPDPETGAPLFGEAEAQAWGLAEQP